MAAANSPVSLTSGGSDPGSCNQSIGDNHSTRPVGWTAWPGPSYRSQGTGQLRRAATPRQLVRRPGDIGRAPPLPRHPRSPTTPWYRRSPREPLPPRAAHAAAVLVADDSASLDDSSAALAAAAVAIAAVAASSAAAAAVSAASRPRRATAAERSASRHCSSAPAVLSVVVLVRHGLSSRKTSG